MAMQLCSKALYTTWTLVLVICSAAAASAADCQCATIMAVVCGEDGNSYQNMCLAECQNVPVVAMGACTAASGRGAKMAEAFHAVASEDPGLLAAMSYHGLAPLTPQQLDQVAAAAATVVQGFDRSLPARLATAADMARLAKQGFVLVGTLKPVSSFDPTPPPVPEDAVGRPAPQFENYGATEAVATADGFLYKPKLLAKHAAVVAVAAAKAAADEVAAAQLAAKQVDSTALDTSDARVVLPRGLVSLQGYLPKDVSTQSSSDTLDSAVSGPGEGAGDGDADMSGPGADPGPSGSGDSSTEQAAQHAGGQGSLHAASIKLRSAGGRRLRTVFSPDDRMEMTTRQKTLVRAVGRVTFELDDLDHACSGAMVGRYTVLTAAHCVLSVTEPGVTATSWTFTPALNKWGPDPRFGRSAASMFYFDTRFWDKDSWWLWDLAIAVLEQPLGRKSGYFGVGYMPDGYKGSLTTAGYPGDKPLWSFWWIPAGANQCVISDNDGTDTVMTHKCDTYPGQSGSPMWIPDSSTILSVVSWERPDTNGACAVNSFWYRFIRSRRPARPGKAVKASAEDSD